MVECLQRIDADQLLLSLNQSVGLEGNLETGHEVVYGGSVETYLTPNAFLTKEPEEIYENKEFNNVPILMGVNKNEGLIFGPMSIVHNPRLLAKWNNEYSNFFPKLFKFQESSLNRCGLSESLWKAYFPQGGKVGADQSDDIANLFSDSVIVSGVRRLAKLHSDHGGSVYLYHFTLKGDNSLAQFFALLIPGNNATLPQGELYEPTHGDELPYLFYMPELYPFYKSSPRFERDSDRIVKLWTSFAKNGKPTELWGGEMKDWKKFDPTEPTWVEINEEVQEMKEADIFGNRMKFWETFFEEIY
jgi:carboxylesterase type B